MMLFVALVSLGYGMSTEASIAFSAEGIAQQEK